MIAYRICELKDDSLYTLFYGISGSRKLNLGSTYTAIEKMVTDGDPKRSTPYKSGFHLLPSIQELKIYSNRFTADRKLVIVECEIEDIPRIKGHSRSNVFLAKTMKPLRIIENLN